MNLFEYLLTNSMSPNEKQDITNKTKQFINDIFSSTFAAKLNNVFDEVKIDEKKRSDDVVAMTYQNKKISINPPKFYSLSKTEQASFLVHELLHIAQNKGDLKLKQLSKTLWKFYNNNKLPGVDVSKVMVGKSNISSRWINKNETINYLITERPRLEFMKPGSDDKLIAILDKSGLFNLSSFFWSNKI